MTRQLKVGLFVILGLGLLVFAVFLIGDTTQLWTSKARYETAFRDVEGLKPGAPVRMGGVDIGEVVHVGHLGDPTDPRIFVKLAITRGNASRIRSDTVAHIVNKGLLGDKMIELAPGSAGAEVLPSGALIPSEEPADVLASANKIVSESAKTIEDVEPLARALGDPKLAADLKGTVEDLHALIGAAVHGDGIVHRLLYDRQAADDFGATLANLSRASARFDGVLAEAQDAAAHLRQGPGIAHALLYDGEMSKDMAGTMLELHEDLRAIRAGNGIAHALLYGDDSTQHVMSNLNVMSDDLRAIVGDVRQGRGTLGALLVDPSVYEDVKRLVGNVERNEVLRALVRYSIKADETRPSPRVEAKPKDQ